jgi:hypothetical protein
VVAPTYHGCRYLRKIMKQELMQLADYLLDAIFSLFYLNWSNKTFHRHNSIIKQSIADHQILSV